MDDDFSFCNACNAFFLESDATERSFAHNLTTTATNTLKICQVCYAPHLNKHLAFDCEANSRNDSGSNV
eukprot:Pgem_evm1s16361